MYLWILSQRCYRVQLLSLGKLSIIDSISSFFFFFGCIGSYLRHAGSSLRHAGSSAVAQASLYLWPVGFLFSSCGRRTPEHVGSVVCGTQAL